MTSQPVIEYRSLRPADTSTPRPLVLAYNCAASPDALLDGLYEAVDHHGRFSVIGREDFRARREARRDIAGIARVRRSGPRQASGTVRS
jgi:hypothetical protein